MSGKMYVNLKMFVASVNAFYPSPYEVTVKPLRDDDGLHAVVKYDCSNRSADNIIECLRFHPMVYDVVQDGRFSKFYFK